MRFRLWQCVRAWKGASARARAPASKPSRGQVDEILDLLRVRAASPASSPPRATTLDGGSDASYIPAILAGRPGLTRPRASPMRRQKSTLAGGSDRGRLRPSSSLILELPARRTAASQSPTPSRAASMPPQVAQEGQAGPSADAGIQPSDMRSTGVAPAMTARNAARASQSVPGPASGEPAWNASDSQVAISSHRPSPAACSKFFPAASP